MAEPSIFTKIINGEIPCHKIYEDDKTFAFLDIYPIQQGHTLVIPKKQVEFVWDLEDDDLIALTRSVRKVAQRMRDVLPQKYVGEVIIGTDVPHAHVHLVPFDHGSEVRAPQDHSVEPDHAALAEIAKKLAF